MAADAPAPDEETTECREARRVRRRRYQEAIDAGLGCAEAAIFADNGEDIGLLRRLIRDGCDPALIAAIVV